MFPKRNSGISIGIVFAEPERVVIIKKPVEQTIIDANGLVKTIVTNEVADSFGDETTNFRAFSVQTLLQVNAIDLLKPIGVLPLSKLSALDVSDGFGVTLENIQQRLDEIKKASASVKAESTSDESKSE